MTNKVISLVLLFATYCSLLTSPALAEFQLPDTFTSCHNPVGDVKADYPVGEHAIVGVRGLQTGSDKVFNIGDDNYTQCYCPSNGQTGIKTNWLAAGNISKEDQNVLITQGWILIANGADWGLSNQPYLAKNSEFSCSGGGSDSGSGNGGGSDTSSGGSGGTGGPGGGDVLGISTLAGTGSPYTKYEIAATILLAAAFIIYGYKIQQKSH